MKYSLMFLVASGSLLFTAALRVRGEGAAPEVTYFDSATVSSAFQKGAVLFDGQGHNYMVHASRREAPGMAEVHTKDADVIYVLEGTATLVTGGTAVSSRTLLPMSSAASPLTAVKLAGSIKAT